MVKNFDDVKKLLKGVTKLNIGIVNATDKTSVEAAIKIREKDLAVPILLGDKEVIQ